MAFPITANVPIFYQQSSHSGPEKIGVNKYHGKERSENMGRTWNVTEVYAAACHLQRRSVFTEHQEDGHVPSRVAGKSARAREHRRPRELVGSNSVTYRVILTRR